MTDKNKKIIAFIYLVTLLFSLFGSTFAYFTYIKTSPISPKTEVETAKTEYISFESGDPISIVATDSNFKEGMNSLIGTTYAKASIPNLFNESLSVKYDVYLEIETNDFIYDSDSTPELTMTVTGPNGEITSIEGLSYINNSFDITSKTGKYYITKDHLMPTSSLLEENYEVTITFVNLDTNQNYNTGKTLEGYLKIERSDSNA